MNKLKNEDEVTPPADNVETPSEGETETPTEGVAEPEEKEVE